MVFWLDLDSEDSKLPLFNGRIIIKATRISWNAPCRVSLLVLFLNYDLFAYDEFFHFLKSLHMSFKIFLFVLKFLYFSIIFERINASFNDIFFF